MVALSQSRNLSLTASGIIFEGLGYGQLVGLRSWKLGRCVSRSPSLDVVNFGRFTQLEFLANIVTDHLLGYYVDIKKTTPLVDLVVE